MSQLDPLVPSVKASWQRFLDVFEPLRPELYRFCRYLTRSPWDAEDLVQDALARGFVTLGTMFAELPNPRAWIFRVASNLWIDRMRRQARGAAVETELAGAPDASATASAAAGAGGERAQREAAGTLLVRLSPQERAAVVLKDVFDFSLDEIAATLSTSVGAVKAALHRGRGKLVAPDEPADRAPAPGVLDAFCAAFNARDLDAMTALLLDSAVLEIAGVVTEYGPDAPRHPQTGSFAGALGPIGVLGEDGRGGIAREHLVGYSGGAPRCEVRAFRGAPILVFWYAHDVGEAVRAVMQVDTEGDRIAHLRSYFFTPDVIAEVCRELALPCRTNGYRYW